jgi:hypothetical protein
MPSVFIDSFTLVAYLALAADLVLQILKVWRREHSADVSSTGIIIRTGASAMLLTKMVTVGDIALVAGQALMVALLFIYLGLVVKYRNTI